MKLIQICYWGYKKNYLIQFWVGDEEGHNLIVVVNMLITKAICHGIIL